MVTKLRPFEPGDVGHPRRKGEPRSRVWYVTYRVRRRGHRQPFFLLGKLVTATTDGRAKREYRRAMATERPELEVHQHFHTIPRGNGAMGFFRNNRPDGPEAA